ncbi:MAG: MoxR family ATPase [Clostridia bacterium]|nr:MoxR family ATPase [Clostridia bacterium]
MQPADIAALARRVQENISRVIVGKEEMLTLMLSALIARGHVLLEDVPGTGKTVTARSLAKSLSASFSRVQFTPDLLPSDITGTRVYQPDKGQFLFHPGPVFAQILLADEINRATPRTQSALLECMEERQVTEGGVTYPLPAPFLVIATQNPVETAGTFPLPEAQLDRFLMKLTPGYPDENEAMEIMARFMGNQPLEELQPVCGCDELLEAQASLSLCEVQEDVRRYIAALCRRTREDERVQLGVSPRGMLALLRACQALALIQGRAFVIPDDVQRLAVPVLAHRVIPKGFSGRGEAARQVVREAIEAVPAPTEAR